MNSVSKFFSLFNASVKANLVEFVTQHSHFVHSILIILRQEGVIFGFSVFEHNSKKAIKVYLRYFDKLPVVKQLIQIYKPGRKVFTTVIGLKLVCSRFLKTHKISLQENSSFFIVATPTGLSTHFEVFRTNRGGTLVCFVAI